MDDRRVSLEPSSLAVTFGSQGALALRMGEVASPSDRLPVSELTEDPTAVPSEVRRRSCFFAGNPLPICIVGTVASRGGKGDPSEVAACLNLSGTARSLDVAVGRVSVPPEDSLPATVVND